MKKVGFWFVLLFLGVVVGEREKLYLGGLFPLTNGWFESLGDQCLQSALLAVEHVNNNTDILPGYELVPVFNDTMGTSGFAVKTVFEYLYGNPFIIALVGALFSGPSISVAEVAGYWHLIQISYSATAPTLSNRQKFPYLFRTISSANDFIPVHIELMKTFGWQRVATLNENNEPHASVTNNLISSLKIANMTVIATESFNSDPTEVLIKLKKKDARIIIGNFFESQAKKVFCEAYKQGLYGPDYVWIINGYYTPGWWDSPATHVQCTREEMLTATEGYLTVVWSMMNQNDSQVTVSGLTPLEYRAVVTEHFGRNIWVPGHQIPATNAYDAVWTVALGLQALVDHNPSLNLSAYKYDKNTSDLLFHEIENIRFAGMSGPVSYTKTGDRTGTLLVEIFHNGTERTVGLYSNFRSTLDMLERNSDIWWRQGGAPPLDADNTEIVEELLEVSRILFYTYSLLACLGILLAICFLTFNIYFRDRRVIKMSSPNLNNLIICGCVGAYAIVIMKGADIWLVGYRGYESLCQAIPWVLSLCFTVAFGAMFAKTWRVYTIFTNKSMKRKAIKDRSLFGLVAVLLGLDLIILLTQQLVDPVYLTRVEMPQRTSDDEKIVILPLLYDCVATKTLYWTVATYAWKGTLLIFGIFLTWQTKGVRLSGLNDSRYIGICIYNVVIFSAVGAPLHEMLSREVTNRYAIIGAFLLFCTTLTLCVVFMPKVFSLYRGESGAETHEEGTNGSFRGYTSQVAPAPVSTIG